MEYVPVATSTASPSIILPPIPRESGFCWGQRHTLRRGRGDRHLALRWIGRLQFEFQVFHGCSFSGKRATCSSRPSFFHREAGGSAVVRAAVRCAESCVRPAPNATPARRAAPPLVAHCRVSNMFRPAVNSFCSLIVKQPSCVEIPARINA